MKKFSAVRLISSPVSLLLCAELGDGLLGLGDNEAPLSLLA